MRLQIRRQRNDTRALAKAKLDTTAADALLARMQDKVNGFWAERERLKRRRTPEASDLCLGQRSSTALHPGVC